MRTSARAHYAGSRFPAEIIGHAVWLYFRFPLGLRMVEQIAGGPRHHRHPQNRPTMGAQVRSAFRQPNPRRLPRVGDKWHLDEVVLKMLG
jgi:putative transposase